MDLKGKLNGQGLYEKVNETMSKTDVNCTFDLAVSVNVTNPQYNISWDPIEGFYVHLLICTFLLLL